MRNVGHYDAYRLCEARLKYFDTITPQSKTRRRRREKILDATHEILSHIGYEQMTMDGVADKAGISKPTLYAYFSGKEELAIAAVGRQMDSANAALSNFGASLSPYDAIEAFARWAVERRFLDSDALLGVALQHILNRESYAASHHALLLGFGTLLERGKSEGVVEPDQDTAVAARLILSAVREFSLRPRSSADLEAYERETQSCVGLLRNAVFLRPARPVE